MLLKLSNSRLNLQGANISHLGKRNIILIQTCFEKKDMLVPRRVRRGRIEDIIGYLAVVPHCEDAC